MLLVHFLSPGQGRAGIPLEFLHRLIRQAELPCLFVSLGKLVQGILRFVTGNGGLEVGYGLFGPMDPQIGPSQGGLRGREIGIEPHGLLQPGNRLVVRTHRLQRITQFEQDLCRTRVGLGEPGKEGFSLVEIVVHPKGAGQSLLQAAVSRRKFQGLTPLLRGVVIIVVLQISLRHQFVNFGGGGQRHQMMKSVERELLVSARLPEERRRRAIPVGARQQCGARPLRYIVELRNAKGRSAGPSNLAVVLAGEAPAPIANLTAEVRKQGVVLHWAPVTEQVSSAVRLHRKLLTPPAAKPHEGLLAPSPEPVEQNLLVDSCAPEGRAGDCRAVDKDIRSGQSYEYRAQRVARVTVDGKTLELAGELSAPVRIEAQDIFPPEVPTGLAAVATIGDTQSQNAPQDAIDLSWQPVPDANLAGYIVYRQEGDAPWQRISPIEPFLGPAFHDAQVQPGHTYRYSVSAIAQNGHESPRSADTEETVPNP